RVLPTLAQRACASRLLRRQSFSRSYRRYRAPAEAPIETTVAESAPAPVLWPASAAASRADLPRWQAAPDDQPVASLLFGTAGSARIRWRPRAPFAPGSP